jgi:hypothetical protein
MRHWGAWGRHYSQVDWRLPDVHPKRNWGEATEHTTSLRVVLCVEVRKIPKGHDCLPRQLKFTLILRKTFAHVGPLLCR